MFKRSGAFILSTLLVVAMGYLLVSQVCVEAQEPVNRKSSAKTRRSCAGCTRLQTVLTKG